MKKRIITFILLTSVLMMCFVSTIHVSATTDASVPVFTMDLSDYEDTHLIKNSALDTPSADGIFVREAGSGLAPNVKKYYSADGKEVYALQIANDNATKDATGVSSLGAVEIDNETIDALLGDDGDKAMTVTFWSKGYNRAYNGSMFNYAVESREQVTNARINTFNMKTYAEFKAAGNGKSSKSGLATDKWLFNAISLSWTDSETTEGMGTWSYTGFVGGNAFSGTTSELSYIDNSQMDMTIGARIDGNNTLSMVFQGEIAGFDVYNTALTQNELSSIKSQQNYGALMTADDMPKSFEVEGTYFKILPIDGTFNVMFNNLIKPDTVGDIKFYDGFGMEITDGFSYDIKGRQIEVTHGVLTDGDTNTLVIPGGISSVNGYKIEEDIVIKVKSVEETSLAELDLNDDTIDSAPNDDVFTYISSGKSDDVSDYTVMEEEGVRFVRMRHKGWGSTGNYSDSHFIYEFGKVYTENFVVDLKLRRGDTPTNATSRLFTANKVTSSPIHNMHATNIGEVSQDELGFFSMRYVFEYQGDNKWQITKFDKYADAAPEKDPVVTLTVSGGLKNIGMALWLQKTTPNALEYTDIAEFTVFPYTFAKMEGDNTDILGEDEDEISVVFDKKMDADTIGEDTFSLFDITDEDNKKEVNIEFLEYVPVYKRATVKLKEYLLDGHTYELIHTGAKCVQGFDADKESTVVFTTDFGGTDALITISEDNKTATVNVSDIRRDTTVYAFFMVIDDKGRAVEVKSDATDKDGVITCRADSSVSEGYQLKCIVWEKVGTQGNKLVSAFSKEIAQ